MLELILVFVVTLFLAKHTPKRRYSLRKVRVSPRLGLSTLATLTAITTALTAASVSTYRAVTVKGSWTMSGLTVGEGPIIVGYAHSDYTVAEIKQSIEASGSINPGSKIENEQSNRLVRIVGTFNQANSSLNDGRPIKTCLNWLISIGDAVNLFAYNDSTGTLTTGAEVAMTGDLWVKDSA